MTLLAENLKGVFADLDDGGLTEDEALTQVRDILERADEPSAEGSVILVETNGAEPENTVQLRGNGVEVINIDWDEVERGDRREYITDILERIEELGVGGIKPSNHVGMPAVVRQLKERLAEMDS